MKKSIFMFILFVSLFFSGLFVSVYSADINCDYNKIISHSVDPIELWREYILVGDQWYLIIYYDDGPKEIILVAKPPLD